MEIFGYVAMEINKMRAYSLISNKLLLIVIILPYSQIKSGESVPISPITGSVYRRDTFINFNGLCLNCLQNISFNSDIFPYFGKKL